ncbi:hypothetical protein BSKO_00201 [Bryopsis sp. KO-2023]|nr:hypothetical protein BSKO_00201 [Bryopsis sp. KO-2023]
MHRASCSKPVHPFVLGTRLGKSVSCFRRGVTCSARDNKGGELLTVKEVQAIAERRGLWLGIESLGPGYKIECRDGGKKGNVLGFTNGFIVPFASYMHCDTLFTKGAKLKDEKEAWGGLGLGVLLGVATFAFGNQQGCRKAEILAINDDEYTARRLVKYYKYFGFKFVKEVSGTDLLDLLVWGGVGTKMSADVQYMLWRWGKALRKEGFE